MWVVVIDSPEALIEQRLLALGVDLDSYVNGLIQKDLEPSDV